MGTWGPTRMLAAAAAIGVAVILVSAIVLRSMEEEPPEPRTGRLLDETWRADTIEPPLSPSSVIDFRVDEGVSWLALTYAIQLPSAEVGQVVLPNGTQLLDPFVVIRLRDRSGAVVWQGWFGETEGGTYPVEGPLPGPWSLHVEGRLYGVDGQRVDSVQFAFQDALHVVVTAA
jgi:hypothetical protein